MAKKARRRLQKNTVNSPTEACRHPAFNLRYTLQGHTSDIHKLALSPNGCNLASSSRDGRVCIWDIERGNLKHVFNHGLDVMSMAWSPNGEIVASGTDRVHLWNAKTGKRVQKPFGGLNSAVLNLAWWSNEIIMASPANGGFYLYAIGEGNPPKKSENDITCMAMSPDEEIIALVVNEIREVLLYPKGGEITELTKNSKKNLFPNYSPYIDILDTRSKFIDTSNKNIFSEFAEIQKFEDIISEDCGLFESSADMQNLSNFISASPIKARINCIAWSPDGKLIALGLNDGAIQIWDIFHKRQTHVLETHIDPVVSIFFINAGQLLASLSKKGALSIWQTDTWIEVIRVSNMSNASILTNLVSDPMSPVVVSPGEKKGSINIWDINLAKLPRTEATTSTKHYVNAKTLLVGDTGVGKTGLGLVLTGQPFVATESTHGRNVWTFESYEVELDCKRKQTRETLLWDLAGQPGYRVIHQLHLNEISLALVCFDARSETDPLAGVHHWDRALRLACQRRGAEALPLRKYLVSTRNDRGGVSVSKSRIESLMAEFGFDSYFETSSKEGWKIEELKAAIREAIDWNRLPIVASSDLFVSIKEFLLESKKSGRFLVIENDLYGDFIREHPEIASMHDDLRSQFRTCISLLENRDLIRRLSFGGYVLLQPECLDSYASAMVNAAKNEPDGLGSIAEDDAITGRFHVPAEQKIRDESEEQLLLHATIEELVQHDLALRETTDDGRYLVLPSQFNRDYEDAPEPRGKVAAIAFEGPIQSIYATLVVRLSHSGFFETNREEMWRNATIYSARTGGKCGIYLREFAEARGQLIIFFDPLVSDETQFNFEEYILSHLHRRALEGTIDIVRFFTCQKCSTPVPDAYVAMLRQRCLDKFNCPCGGEVSLVYPKEKLAKRYPSKVDAMDRSADRQRDLDAFLVSARGETQTKSFVDWAGGEKVTLAIVFTDVIGSTALGKRLGDERMGDVLKAHFKEGRKQLDSHKGREIKTIGDSLMAAFHNAGDALDFALALHKNTGHKQIKIRVGIHIGALRVEDNDTFGGTVNFAARVVKAIKDEEIWLSERAKQDIDQLGSRHHGQLKWGIHEDVDMKGFDENCTLWSVV